MVSEVVDTVEEEGSTHSFIRTHSLTVYKWEMTRLMGTRMVVRGWKGMLLLKIVLVKLARWWRFVRMNCTTPEQVKEKLKRIQQLEKKEGKDWTVTPVFLF